MKLAAARAELAATKNGWCDEHGQQDARAFSAALTPDAHREALLRFGKQVVDYIVTPPLGVWLECHGNPATVARRLDLAALLLKVAP